MSSIAGPAIDHTAIHYNSKEEWISDNRKRSPKHKHKFQYFDLTLLWENKQVLLNPYLLNCLFLLILNTHIHAYTHTLTVLTIGHYLFAKCNSDVRIVIFSLNVSMKYIIQCKYVIVFQHSGTVFCQPLHHSDNCKVSYNLLLIRDTTVVTFPVLVIM